MKENRKNGEMKEKRIRDYTWDDYGISTFRYKELKNFCLQYREKKNRICYGLRPAVNDGMPKGTGSRGPVERAALENLSNEADCSMIEQAALAANPGIWKYILRSVADGLPYELIEYDEEQGRISVGKTDFYGYRRLFFRNLHLLKIGDKLKGFP